MIGRTLYLMVWIGIWTQLRIYRVPPDPVRWSCRSLVFICHSLMLNCMLWTKNDFKVSQRKQDNAPSNMNLVTSLMNFECQPCGVFEGLSHHHEDEVVDTTIFADTVGLGDRIKKLVSSKFKGMVRSVSVIFDTGSTYSYYSNKGYFVNLEEKKFRRKIKGIVNFFETSVFGIVEYSVRIESGHIIALRDQA